MEKTKNKIQLSPRRIIKDAMTVWTQPGPEVDVVMDLKNLTFRENSIDEIYVFHVLDSMFPDENEIAVKNWFKVLAPGGFLHAVNDDFEYLARAFVGGDISIHLFNDIHNHPCQCTKENIVPMLRSAGFKEDEVRVWLSGAPEGIDRKHYEFILSAKKHAEQTL